MMKLTNLPEGAIDWQRTPSLKTPGASGSSSIRAYRSGDIQQRIVDYAPGYLAYHWCAKGHVLYVIAGALTIEHENGEPAYALSAGMSWHVGDGEGPAHRVRSEHGARVFIVD
jgi:hypothetical protein